MPAPRRARLPRGTLTRDVIVDAAVRALSEPGAYRMTMRSLAGELGADPTAVYRHFRNKDELLAALTDRLLDPLASPDLAAGWREQLDALGSGLHAIFERTPGAVMVLAESPFTLMSLRAIDQTLAALLAHEMPPDLAVEACQAVIAYTIGHSASAAGDPAGFWGSMFDTASPPGELPALRATAASWSRAPLDQFRAGLALLLDGIGSRHPAG